MKSDQIVAMLSEQNVSLAVDGDELVVRGEQERLDSALIDLLRQNKAELLEFLRAGAAASPLVTLSAAEMASVIAAVPGGAENVQDVYPLAPLQDGILFHHLLSGEGDPYLSCETYWFENRERLDAYLAALQRAIARHDALRTAILWEGLAEPVQVVLRSAPLVVEEITGGFGDGDVAEQLAARFSPRHYRLDLRQAPLLRAFVAREPHGECWAMVLLEHHVWGDNTSVQLLRREIEAHLLGRTDDLPAPVSFGDFIAQARRGVSREEHELFFRELLADVDEPTAPFGLIDAQRDGSRIREASASVDGALAERLRSAARANGVSTASVVHVAWARVLARVSGRDDVVFGTVLFGRGEGEGVERALGMFTNTLPVRARIDGGVGASVEAMQTLLAQLLRHEHAPLTLAQACSAVPASTPLFSSLLNYRHGAAPSAQAGGAWDGVSLLGGEERTNYPIGVSVNDTGAELKLSVKSDASVDPERLCGYVQTALAGVVEALERDAARTLASVEVVPEPERARVLYEWNATEHPFGDDRFVHELFEEQAWRAPKAVALEFDGARLSYGELNARANRLARHLRMLGVQAQTRVGVLMERSLELVVGVLAVLKAGAVYVPLDPAYPEERLAFMLADAAPPVVLTHPHVARDRAELLRQAAVRVVDVVADADAWSWEPECNPPALAAPSDPAYVIYTSGSTGAPKGVMVSHEQLCSRLLGAQLDLRLGRADVVTNLASPAFDIALFELLMPLVTGGRSLLLGAADVRDLAQLRARTRRATVFHAVPTLMEAWLDAIGPSEYGALHTLLVGGEAVPQRLLRKLTERFPQARVFELYGPTEAVIVSTRYRADGTPLEGVANCIGRPFANTRTYVLDARMQPAPIGVGGELYVGGAQVALGYLNRDDLTAERFIASPFVDGDRLYKTGDLARYLPDSNIEFLGRNDFQVKIRGFRIELGEIEARLWSYPGVRDIAVIALEDRAGEKRLVAYYTAGAAAGAPDAPSAEDLRGHVAATLPDYMIPAAYVHLAALPLTAHGKLDRRALPAPDEDAYVSRAYEAPAGDVELTLAAVWRELLGVERVGRNDNFFELGGHSLLVVAALERLRQVGLHVDAAAFFASTTLSELASAVREESLQVAIPPNAIPDGCTAIAPEMLPLVALNAAEIAAVVSAVPGGAANVQDVYPLAPLQEGVLFHHLLGGEGDPYLSRTVYRFESRARLDAYLQALEAVIARHDVLRTAVVWEGLSEPVQVVLRRAPLTVEEVSADPAAGDVGEQLAARFDPRSFRLDVRQAPIMRAYVARGAGEAWAMVLLKHHLLGDHTAMELMQAEVEAHLLGRADALPEPVPFRNFIAQARLGVSREEHELFFRELLEDVDEPTAPYGLVDVRRDGSATRQAFEVVDAALAHRLRSVARSIGVSTASICHVAWARVLARVSGRDDVVFGTLMFGRMQGAGSDRALGMFMNTLPVRLKTGGRGVRESVDEAQLLLAQLLRHEHASLALAQRCSAVPGSLPLFTALLNYRHDDSDTTGDAWEGITVEEAEERTNYPIGMSVNDHGGGALSLSVKSDASVDPSRLSAYMQTALAGVVEALERDPARPLTSVEVVPEDERARVLVEWNATERDYAAARCVHELFEDQASRAPESVALEMDGERLSYGELDARANRLARHLRTLGVQARTRVGVLMERSPEFVVAVLGVLKAGGAYVPLDPAYPSERLAFMLGDAAPPVVLTHGRVARERADVLSLTSARVVDVVADDRHWSAESDANLPGAAGPSDLAYVIYTSGSTGAPKGVMVSHEQLSSRLLGAQLDLGFRPADVVTNLASPAFDIALFELLMPLTTGGCSLLLSSAQVKDLEQLRARTQHATVFHAVPTLMEAWLDALGASEYGSLHTLLVGGEAVPERLLRKLTQRFPAARVFEFYGPTEAVIISTRFRADGSPLEGVANCIGRPFANTRTYILDARMQPAPIGVAAELYIGGAQVAQGYLNRADLTAERFIASPFVDGDRLYKTGDLARYLPDGNIEFLGRNDFQVKIRGFRIELGEIEARLWSYPGVRDVAVVALEDRTGEKRLAAYYTAPTALSAEELRGHVAATLPDYMIPAAYVQLDALPLTAHGKLDRRALPAPDDGAYVSHAYEAPAGDTELTLAAVWRELLGVERVGRNDNFFELGGHSLLVVAALERLRQAGLHVDAAAFFASGTLKELAAAVKDESSEVAIPPNAIPEGCTHIAPEMLPLVQLTVTEIAGIVTAVPGGAANVQDVYPLAPLQEGVLFHHLLGGEGDPYLSRTAYRFESRERLDAYLNALESVIARHDVLCTAVVWENLPEPVQVVLRRAPLAVEEVTVDPAAGDVAEQLAERFNPRHFRLDVRQAPIMRAYVARDAGDGWAMVLLKHHLLGDHTAMEVMEHEVQMHLLGRADELAEPVPFRNFIAQARLGVSREEHEQFFREMLVDVDEPTAPFGLVDVRRDGSTTRQTYQVVDAALAERLRAVARAAGVSAASVCHVAWARVLARVSGRDDVVFGTLLFGRMQAEGADRAIGMFMNTLPVRLRVGKSVRESVEDAHVLLAQLLRHEHAPLALAQRCSAVPGSTPLFSSLLNYRHGARKSETSADADRAWQGIAVLSGEERTNYPVGMSVNDHGDELSLSVKSDESVDPDRLCGYMQTALAGVVEALEREPARALASVEVVPERERAQVVYEWNATERAYDAARCVHQLFEEQVVRAPESVALEFDGERISYAELNAQANRLARHLQSLGVQAQTLVGVLMERSFEFVTGVLAVLKAGGTYVPLDPAYPDDRLSSMLADAAPPVVLTHGRVAPDRLEPIRQSAVRVVDVSAGASDWSAMQASDLQGAAAPSDPAYVIYTSGSTGAPKGVVVTHEQLCSRLLGAQLDLSFGPADVMPNLASPAFDIALFELLMPLTTGGCSLLLTNAQVKDPEQLRARTQHATVFHAVPTLMEAWLDSLGASEYGSLHTLLVGGEAVPERLLIKLRERFPKARVFEFYGPTEAVIISTRYRADGAAPNGVAHCIGRPFANTRAYVLDACMQPTPIGVGGELYIGGAQIAQCYLNRADLTAERFIASPFVEGDRLYKTGDLARYLPDGNIEFLGRNDFQVKIRGFRIELGEIEARLAAHPAVREAAVVPLEGRDGERRLVAYYVAREPLAADELRGHVAAALPEYMIPAAYVQLDALPLTAHGKLDRRALPAPDDAAYASRAYEAPAGETEITLAAVWRELLGVERVGRNDNFFELGGHSLLVVAALERLRQVGLHVDAAAFFASNTLRELASAVRDESVDVAIPPNAIADGCTRITPEMLPLVQLSASEIAAVVAAVPGGAANVQDIYPLAPLQEGILFHHILGGEGDPYLGRSTYRFESRERVDAYLAALDSVIARHDVLRTAVLWEGLPEPVQVVLRRAPLAVEEVSVDPAAGDVAGQLAERFNPRRFRLDVRQAPIMRAYVARDAGSDGDGWAMVLLKHHLLGDHTAMEVMEHEVEAHLLGRAHELPVPVPFRNFIAQAKLGVSREEHEQFFREMLADVDEPTAPFGLVDVRRDGSTTRQTYQVVDAALGERLRTVARSTGVSTASICHVAWARVLARVSGRDDVVFGTLLFGRMQGEGSGRALGMFMNTLPVRLKIGARGVRESVEETQLLLAQLLRHEHAPLTLAQACSAVPASTPLFSALLNYRHGKPRKSGDDEAWKGFAASGGEERTNYPIGMSVNDHGDELSLSVKSDASVDPDRLCGYMQAALAGVADALQNEPARALVSIEVVPERERAQLLVEWNATERPYPTDRRVHQLFEEQAARAPEAPAVEFDGVRVSYAELNARANRLARYLQKVGVQAQTRVGVLMERSPELVTGVLAVLKAGGTYVPLDPAYPHERLSYMLADAAPHVVLTHARAAAERAELLHRSPARVVDVVADAAGWAAEPTANLRGAAGSSDVAYVIYTSGSTGAPKGVMVSHGQLCSRLLGVQRDLGFGDGDVVTNLASPAFDIALFELLMPLINGGCSLLLTNAQVKDPEQLRARTQHATVFHAVPTLMEAWLDALGAGEYRSLHTVLVGGEAVPERLLIKLRERFPKARVFELYGPTEAVIVSTRYRVDGIALNGVANCIGRPFANTRIYILDARMEPAPIGVGGELYIGGAQVAQGYLNRDDLTAERFIANPFVNGDRLYKSGDLARYLPDGNIEFLGRNDFQVKIRGFRIELGEIEARLGAHPAVREAAVVPLDDRHGEKRLVAYYAAPAPLSAEELRDYLAATLPDYMVPAAYVQLDALPLTAHGKLDRRVLPAPDDGAYASRAYEAPAGDVELTLAAVWRELLNVERVGRNDNFFELGGHSLLVVAALERLRQVGLHVDAAAFFASNSLRELASAVRDESVDVAIPPNAIDDGCTHITPEMLPLVQLSASEIAAVVAAVPGGAANVQDIYPLAPLQEGILFHHILGGEGDPYLGRSTYRFESRERLDAYLAALE
ncbi:MAG: amino acid adenylation domain-containing protein, partial [Candidatus Eremiobacteraeota bacterium]|nr:amino acid adenylation domain-containing protein [Candidatus Eremiobacteraeota bacterium]